MKLSLIVPCYNEEGNILPFTQRVREVFVQGDYEIIFVNDGSNDGTLSKIKTVMAQKRDKIKCICFSRNFGKEAAMYAGMQSAQSEYVAVIDADLQQDPSYVRQMMDILDGESDVDIVCAYQQKRKESKVVSLMKKCFYSVANAMSDTKMQENASDFRLFRKKAIDAVLSLGEYHRFSKGIFSFIGFNTKFIPYEVKQRASGKSKWSIKALFKYAFSGIFAFSVKPLKIPGIFGVISLMTAFIMLITFLITGFTIEKVILTCMFFLSSLILLSLRAISEYLALTYIQGKNRPVFIISKTEQNF